MNSRKIFSLATAAVMLFGATATGFAQTNVRAQRDTGLGSQRQQVDTRVSPFDAYAYDGDFANSRTSNRAPLWSGGNYDRAVNGSDASTPGHN